MKVMGIDTSTRACSVSIIGEEEDTLVEYTQKDKRTHSQKLLPLVDKVLLDSGYCLDELDGISVVIGPGSFTGLRIGLATAQGISAGSGIPLVGITSLDVLAYSRPGEGLICPLMDARKKEVYTSLYKAGKDEPERLWEYRVISLERLFEDLQSLKENGKFKEDTKIIYTGDGVKVFREELWEKSPFQVLYTFEELEVNRASVAARLGLNEFKKGKSFGSHELTPLYVRKSEAEKKREERKKREAKEG